jgi:hypothetical protein
VPVRCSRETAAQATRWDEMLGTIVGINNGKPCALLCKHHRSDKDYYRT